MLKIIAAVVALLTGHGHSDKPAKPAKPAPVTQPAPTPVPVPAPPPPAPACSASCIPVATSDQLSAALAKAVGGQTIQLAPGAYAGVALDGFSPSAAVTVTSRDPANPATIASLTVDHSRNLTVTNLNIISSGAPPAIYYYDRITNSSNITLDGVHVAGSDPTPGNNAAGLLFQNDTNITVRNSTFTQLGTAIVEGLSTGVTITGNTFHNLESDGIDNNGTSNLTISGNAFTDFHPSALDHPDAIQFWTENTTAPAVNITVSNNTITRGAGVPVQGVFVQDDSGKLPYVGLVVTGNTCAGCLYNGILVSSGTAPQITGNTVLGYADQQSWIYVGGTTGAVLSGNRATSYNIPATNPGLVNTGNATIAAVAAPPAR
jgi:hypothetical protein